MLRNLLVALLAFALAAAVHAADRSSSARAEFIRQNPCPATGKKHGPCPGWQVDHVVALCAGGEDRPGNMQWLTVREHKVKTRHDARFCRSGSTVRMP